MATAKDTPAITSYQNSSLGDRLVEADQDDESWDIYEEERELLLLKAQNFSIAYDVDRGYRGTELKFTSFQRPHMRAFHASWMLFFTSFFVQFSQAPLLPEIQASLSLSKRDIWWTNLWMMAGGVPMRFLMGPLCDKYGARTVMTTVVALAAIPCTMTGLVATNLRRLTIIRFLLGAMDSFVPGQYWITCHFVREVGGTAMALAGGLGATGSGVTQLVIGSLVFSVARFILDGDSDLAWRWALVVPGALAVLVALYFYRFSDDCPLGNFEEVRMAGLMVERSAVDSFRSGAHNLNSWLLFLQYAGSCGVDFTMCNGTAIYYHYRFKQSIPASGVIAFLYGTSAIFARGLGGWLSDFSDRRFSLRGRLWALCLSMVGQGLVNVLFARSEDLSQSLVIMVIFSVLVQMSMGACFGIVPYVDAPNTGSVAGIVGAGGNVGAALLAAMFMFAEYDVAMESMGWLSVLLAFLTPLVVIKGYKGMVWGDDNPDHLSSRTQRSPLLVPGKVQHSPHFVKYRRRRA